MVNMVLNTDFRNQGCMLLKFSSLCSISSVIGCPSMLSWLSMFTSILSKFEHSNSTFSFVVSYAGEFTNQKKKNRFGIIVLVVKFSSGCDRRVCIIGDRKDGRRIFSQYALMVGCVCDKSTESRAFVLMKSRKLNIIGGSVSYLGTVASFDLKKIEIIEGPFLFYFW